MVTATIGQIWGAVSGGALLKLVNAPLPVKTSYWIGRTAEAAQKEYERAKGVRDALIRKIGKQEGEGEAATWKVEEKDMAAFEAEFGELLNESVEIAGRKVGLEEIQDVELTGLDLLSLGFLLEEEEEAGDAAPEVPSIVGRKAKKAKA